MSLSACQQVFVVPELVGKILLELPPKDILAAQRVQTSFRDAVQASKPLQRALFLLASPPTDQQQDAQVNNLVLDISDSGIYFSNIPGTGRCDYQPHKSYEASLYVYDLSTDTIPDLETFVNTDTSSWLDMYLQTPAAPITILLSTSERKSAGKHWSEAEATVSAPTMRQLLSATVAVYRAAEEHEKLYMRRDDLETYNGETTQKADLRVVHGRVLHGKDVDLLVQVGSIAFDCFGEPEGETDGELEDE